MLVHQGYKSTNRHSSNYHPSSSSSSSSCCRWCPRVGLDASIWLRERCSVQRCQTDEQQLLIGRCTANISLGRHWDDLTDNPPATGNTVLSFSSFSILATGGIGIFIHTIRYDTIDDLHWTKWQSSCQFTLAHKLKMKNQKYFKCNWKKVKNKKNNLKKSRNRRLWEGYEAWDRKTKEEITITETRKKWNETKNRKAVLISVKSVRMGAKCLWRVGFEKVKSFEVGKEEWWVDGW